ncbi:flagellar hook-basal body protein [Paenisporosarcina cavernae]|uniref:Flagellar hook-basal body protein n=1 Tax=Paenisporosarcina cavernae TaxID=2320858 RepID=A0A385YQ36_9BACL|nr:flagellar hook-basal body protein [Paenisporosarcina cavernae]AYC28845.1 flagellar hook-basal body protein [Paenisporosarcina cavernae]
MFRGFYTVASGMIAQQRRTELLTNNMANANTPGYKADQSVIRSFPDMLMARMGSKSLPVQDPLSMKKLSTVGGISTGVYMQETLPHFEQGQLLETELPTDIAMLQNTVPINADGNPGAVLYRLENPVAGEYYTRNGNFTLDADGYLTNPQGLYVLSDTGQRIQLQNDDFQVEADGRLLANNQEVARIGVSFSAAPESLLKEENGLFRTADGQNLASAYDTDGVAFSMQQGFLEGSTVDSAKTMTEMLTAYRAFEANQKILQAYDRSMEKAVNEIGRV